MRGDDFRINFGQTVIGRDATGAEHVQVPLTLPIAARGLATRGPVAWAIKGLKVFGVDLAGDSAKAIGQPGRLSARAIEQAPGAREAIPVQPCHRGIRADGDRHQHRHDGRALAAVPPRDAVEHVGQFRRALVEAARGAADRPAGRVRRSHHRVRARHADPEPDSERARARGPPSAQSHAPHRQPLAWRPGWRAAVQGRGRVERCIERCVERCVERAGAAPGSDTPLHRLAPFTEEELASFAAMETSELARRQQQLEMLRGLQRELQARDITRRPLRARGVSRVGHDARVRAGSTGGCRSWAPSPAPPCPVRRSRTSSKTSAISSPRS